MKYTPGPWQWAYSGGSFYLRTVGRGLLTVMDFVRMGMQQGQPRFAKWEGEDRGRLGGIMHKAEDLGELHEHPDALLIAAAPELLGALEAVAHWMSDAQIPCCFPRQTVLDAIDRATKQAKPKVSQ